jgi:hypothetical protein
MVSVLFFTLRCRCLQKTTRHLFTSIINNIFNIPDLKGIKERGADRVAAEFTLRMGGTVKLIKEFKESGNLRILPGLLTRLKRAAEY